jgi:hypothetical protein
MVWLLAGSLALAACASRSVQAATPGKASNSRADREDALAKIPLKKLKPEVRAKLSAVLDKPTIFRRLPEKTINCDPDMYLFLVRSPEVVVNIWELMGVTNVKLKRVGDFKFECSDGAGTDGTVELIYGTQNMHILYTEATYEGSLTGHKLNGRGVLLLRSEYRKDEVGRMLVDNQLDVFLQLDHVAAEIVARTLQPILGKAADVNFTESATFVGRVSQAAEANGPGMQRLAAKLKNVAPEIRSQFSEISGLVSERATAREQGAALDDDDDGVANLPMAPESAPPKKGPQLRR